MTFLERLDYAKKLWGVVLPGTPPPPQPTLISWLAVYSDDEFEKVIVRIPYRLTQNPSRVLSPDEIYTIISSQLKDARKAQRRQHSKDARDVRSFDGRVA
jgi:hypothetical protein